MYIKGCFDVGRSFIYSLFALASTSYANSVQLAINSYCSLLYIRCSSKGVQVEYIRTAYLYLKQPYFI